MPEMSNHQKRHPVTFYQIRSTHVIVLMLPCITLILSLRNSNLGIFKQIKFTCRQVFSAPYSINASCRLHLRFLITSFTLFLQFIRKIEKRKRKKKTKQVTNNFACLIRFIFQIKMKLLFQINDEETVILLNFILFYLRKLRNISN